MNESGNSTPSNETNTVAKVTAITFSSLINEDNTGAVD